MGLLLPARRQKETDLVVTTRSKRVLRFEKLYDAFRVGDGLSPLSERELVETAIDFANRGDPQDWWPLVIGVKRTPPPPGSFWEQDERGLASPFESERDQFRASLSIFMQRREFETSVSKLAESAEHMILVPSFEIVGKSVRLEYWYVSEDMAARLSYIQLLLTDPSKPYGSDLCQCQLGTCGKFFFVQKPKTGRPRRNYCCDEHMLEVHEAQSPARVEKSRRLKKAKKARKAK